MWMKSVSQRQHLFQPYQTPRNAAGMVTNTQNLFLSHKSHIEHYYTATAFSQLNDLIFETQIQSIQEITSEEMFNFSWDDVAEQAQTSQKVSFHPHC